MAVDGDAERLQARLVGLGLHLAREARDDHATDCQAHAAEDVHQAQDVVLVGDADVAAALAGLDVVGVDREDDLGVVGQKLEHAGLGVGLEAGQDAGGVVVVKELAAELEVELAAELRDALADLLGLNLEVLIVVETAAHVRRASL